MFFLFAMVKAIVPRYRYDQLMRLGWKVFLPISLAMVVIVAGACCNSAGLAPKGVMSMRLDQAARSIFLHGVRVGVLCSAMRYFFKPKATLELSVREGADLAALPRRACAAPLSERRGALHRLQAVRGDLPGAGHHHRGRPAPQRRHAPHHALRHRHGEVHLLRPLPGGLPGRRHRRRARTSSSPPRRARSSTTTRNGCSRTATAGSARSPRTSRSTRRTGEG